MMLFIDVLQPIDEVNREIAEAEAQGFILVGQHGGGDLGTYLLYDRDSAENRRKHDAHMKAVKRYWEEFHPCLC